MIQLAIDYTIPKTGTILPEEGTQNRTILEALQRGEYLSVADALVKYGVYALSQRCGELRRMGWPVQSQMKTTKTGKRIAVYSL